MKNQTSPGPWSVEGVEWRNAVINVCETGPNRLIAECRNRSDANLIAHAPDMLIIIDEMIHLLDPVLARHADKIDPFDAKLLNKLLYRAFRLQSALEEES